MRLVRVLVSVALLTITASQPAVSQVDIGSLMGTMIDAARKAEQQRLFQEQQRQQEDAQRRRVQLQQRAVELEDRRRVAEEREQQRIDRDRLDRARAADQKRKDDQEREEREARLKKDALNRVTAPARQLQQEAVEFLKQATGHSQMLVFVEKLHDLQGAIDKNDPERIEAAAQDLSARLNNAPEYRDFLTRKAELTRQRNASEFAGTLQRSKQQNQFIADYIKKNPLANQTKALIPLYKELEEANVAPSMERLGPLVEKVDNSIRQLGLRDLFINEMARIRTAPSGTITKEGQLFDDLRTPRTALLLDGALDDILFLYNSSPRSPNVIKNLRQDLVFENSTATACIVSRRSDLEVEYALRAQLKTYTLKSLTLDSDACRMNDLLRYDIIALRRGDLLKGGKEQLAQLAKHVESSELTRLAVIVSETQKSATLDASQQVAKLRREIEAGLVAGFGLVILPNGSSRVCIVGSANSEGHKELLQRDLDRLRLELSASPEFSTSETLDAAYFQIQRRQCGAVYSAAADLKLLLQTTGEGWRLSAMWHDVESLKSAQVQVDARTASRDIEEMRRRQERDAKRDLDLQREKEELESLSSRRKEFRTKYGKLAQARASQITDHVKAIIADSSRETPSSQSFPYFHRWLSERMARKWEIQNVGHELTDFGRAKFKGRDLEAVLQTVHVRLRNRTLGEYEDACYVFGLVHDTEFDVQRDPFVARCNDNSTIDQWKSGHEFQTQWFP